MWRVDHPLGFYARPEVVTETPQKPHPNLCINIDGSQYALNLLRWHCGVPAKSNVRESHSLFDKAANKSQTNLRDHYFDLTLTFSMYYPEIAPKVQFQHPALQNLSIIQSICTMPYLVSSEKWTPSITISRILCGLQDALYRHKLMDVPHNFVGTYTRLQDQPFPFFPYCDQTALTTGMHSIIGTNNGYVV